MCFYNSIVCARDVTTWHHMCTSVDAWTRLGAALAGRRGMMDGSHNGHVLHRYTCEQCESSEAVVYCFKCASDGKFVVYYAFPVWRKGGGEKTCLHPVSFKCPPLFETVMAASPSVADDPFLYCRDCLDVAHRGRKRCYHQEEQIAGHDQVMYLVCIVIYCIYNYSHNAITML